MASQSATLQGCLQSSDSELTSDADVKEDAMIET